MIRQIFDFIGIPVLVAIFWLLFFLESRFALRKRVQDRWKRIAINTVISIPGFALLRFLLIPVMVWIAIENQDLQFGLNYLYQWPVWAEGVIAVLVLDYTNYVWHILNHKLPALWRFHLVHHTDHDLDVTTAFRFHFGEMIGSVIFRGAMVLLTGASPVVVLIYEILFEAATEFHHSNTRLPLKFEKALSRLIVTPRMHGIHHSVIRQETDSNFSVIFSFWDRLHRTLRLNRQQHEVVIGVPAYSDQSELTAGYLLKLPFTKIRPWPKVKQKAHEKQEMHK